MNATRYEFAVNIYEDQLEEASLCLLHTIIFHRTTGKYVGNDKGFQIGSVGFKDVNCKTIPLTYIMVSVININHFFKFNLTDRITTITCFCTRACHTVQKTIQAWDTYSQFGGLLLYF